ncbi:hypothetical protein ACH4FX_32205 [Streptomyces sp. NPDC018019]|uniref:hypothetical protein n=1 Tax=Streptomyces sp. NPDC018019 TaxID=3365030 RepID=UPI00379E9BAA
MSWEEVLPAGPVPGTAAGPMPGPAVGPVPGPRGDDVRTHLPAPPPAWREPVTVRISALDLSGSPRIAGCDVAHVRALAEVDPADLPPIIVHRATMRVLDGAHRVQAMILRGGSEISAELFCGTEKEGFVHAVRTNAAHGLPLSMEDRKAAARRILRDFPYCSDRSLGEVAGLSAKTIAGLRRRSSADGPQLNTARLGRDGRVRPASTAEGRLRAGRILREDPTVSLREVAQRAGISLGTAQDVSRRLRNGRDLLPAQQSQASAVARRIEVHSRTDDGAAEPAARRRGAAQEPPAAISLDRLPFLRQDVALRSTNTGRDLLRLLIAQEAVLGDGDGGRLAAEVPPHCLPALAETARACGRLWAEFAESLARREQAE